MTLQKKVLAIERQRQTTKYWMTRNGIHIATCWLFYVISATQSKYSNTNFHRKNPTSHLGVCNYNIYTHMTHASYKYTCTCKLHLLLHDFWFVSLSVLIEKPFWISNFILFLRTRFFVHFFAIFIRSVVLNKVNFEICNSIDKNNRLFRLNHSE